MTAAQCRTKAMRITQVMLSKELGGGERIFIDICLSLAEKGHSIQAVCHPEFKGRVLLKHPKVDIYRLKVRCDWSISARFKLINFLKKFKPQIIHTHMARASIVGGAAGRFFKIPAVANIHDYVKLKYYKNISTFLPGTKDLKEYLIKKGVKPDRIKVVPHFSRIPAVDNISIKKNVSFEIMSFGRFSPEKGFGILIESIKILKDQGYNVLLKLGGGGPEKDKLIRQINSLDLNNSIELTGWVNNVPDFLKTGSVFILPSLREAFGIVILEAMSQGKVIISSDAPGPSEILDESTGYLFPAGNANALADCIKKVVEDPERSKARASNALSKFKTSFSTEKVIPMFEACYTDELELNKDGN